MKHFILTRFLSDPTMNLGYNILNEDIILYRLNLTKKYLIPSLDNQSNKNFTLIFIIHEDLPIKIIKELKSLSKKFEIIISKKTEYISIINNAYKNNNYLVTSRIDDDDMIYYNSIQDIHDLIDENPILKVHGYKYGGTLVDGEKDIYEFKPAYPNDAGVIALMCSIIINTNIINPPLTIYNVGNHTKIKNRIEETYQYHGLPSIPHDFWCINDKIDPAWIYIRHKYSDNKTKHGSSNIINVDLLKLFGYLG